jgi:hypothetical protein
MTAEEKKRGAVSGVRPFRGSPLQPDTTMITNTSKPISIRGPVFLIAIIFGCIAVLVLFVA